MSPAVDYHSHGPGIVLDAVMGFVITAYCKIRNVGGYYI